VFFIYFVLFSNLAGDANPLKDTVLIVDEVDDLIVDANPNQPYSVMDTDREEFRKACDHFHNHRYVLSSFPKRM
jgi:hypothetical protein